jgi:hypothetical protein
MESHEMFGSRLIYFSLLNGSGEEERKFLNAGNNTF